MTRSTLSPTTHPPGSRLSWDDLSAVFDSAPTSMWMQDLGALKTRLDEWRVAGMTDLRAWLTADPARVEELVGLVQVVAVNAETLHMYEVADEAELFANIRVIFGDDQIKAFVDVIGQLWDGARRTSVLTRNYTSKGHAFDVSYNGRLLPGHETSWSRYLISVEDVTARERAFRQLEFARTHDGLTGLCNRTFLSEEMDRMERSDETVALAVIDLNGLKTTNDRDGHRAGDELLRRMAHVLLECFPAPSHVARMGGDEFVVLMPGIEMGRASDLFEALARRANGEGAEASSLLSYSIGSAWRRPGESMESLFARADHLMYESKRAFYGEAAA